MGKLLKLSILSICVIMLFQTANAADKKTASPVMQSPEIGRYQLFQGKYRNKDLLNNQTTIDDALFLLDTASGNVFICDRDYWVVAAGEEMRSFKVDRSCKLFDEKYDVSFDDLDKIRKSKPQ